MTDADQLPQGAAEKLFAAWETTGSRSIRPQQNELAGPTPPND
jgi:hypothetical protein